MMILGVNLAQVEPKDYGARAYNPLLTLKKTDKANIFDRGMKTKPQAFSVTASHSFSVLMIVKPGKNKTQIT